MTDALFVQIQPSPKGGAAKLFARVEANSFCGFGSAWIDLRELARLSISLSQAFPRRETIAIHSSQNRFAGRLSSGVELQERICAIFSQQHS